MPSANLYRSPRVFIPPSYASDLDSESQSDDLLPTPYDLTPPGLPPRPVFTPPFVPAIHGSDVPKAAAITALDPHPLSTVSPEAEGLETLWAGYGETDAPPDPDLCEVHGVMCSRGVCRACARRKRQKEMEQRTLRMQEEKEERNKRREEREARRGRREDRERRSAAREGSTGSGASSPGTSASEASSRAGSVGPEEESPASRLREDIPLTTTRGKLIRAMTAPAGRAAPRALPPHLRKGASKLADTASSAPPSTLTVTAKTRVPAASSRSSSEPGEDDASPVSSAKNVTSSDAQRPGISVIQPSPFATLQSYQPSTGNEPTGNAKQVQPMPSARKRWADMIDEDEDEDEYGEGEGEDESEGEEDDMYLPRGATVIPTPVARIEDTESVFSGFSDAEPF